MDLNSKSERPRNAWLLVMLVTKLLLHGLPILWALAPNTVSGQSQWDEFLVSTPGAPLASSPVVTSLSDSAYAVAWIETAQEGGARKPVVACFDSAARRIGQLRSATWPDSLVPAQLQVVGLEDGGFVVTIAAWVKSTPRHRLVGLIYQDLTARPTMIELADVSYKEIELGSTVALREGGFAVVWAAMGKGMKNNRILLRRFYRDGAPSTAPIIQDPPPGSHTRNDVPRLLVLGDNGYLVYWRMNGRLRGNLLHQNWRPRREAVFFWTPYASLEADNDHVVSSDALHTGHGRFILAWNSFFNGVGHIVLQEFDSDGNPTSSYWINPHEFRSDKLNLRVANICEDKFALCWQYPRSGTYGWQINTRVMELSFKPASHEVRVNRIYAGHKESPDIAALLGHSFLICWQAERDWTWEIRGRILPATPPAVRLNAFHLLEPKNDATLRNRKPTFRWSDAYQKAFLYDPHVVYRLIISEYPDFDNALVYRIENDTSLTVPLPLNVGITYFWKVQALVPGMDQVQDTEEQNWGFFVHRTATGVNDRAVFDHASGHLLYGSYPNPLNTQRVSGAGVSYRISESAKNSPTAIRIYDLLGRLVRTLVNEAQGPGIHTVAWDGRDDLGSEVASGVYLVRMQAGVFVQSRKMTLMR